VSVKARLEFLDGSVFEVALPAWHQEAVILVSPKPGTMENVNLDYVRTTRALVRVYRERPPARIIPFPLDRVKRKAGS
jgi:hypothetical protein